MLVATKFLFSIFLFTLLTAQLEALSFNTVECGKTKGCFVFPDTCDSSDSCDFLVTYNTSSADTVEFELSGKGAWAAVGFSENGQMPDTDIIMCVDPTEQPRSGHYYADGRTPPVFQQTTSAVTIRDVVLEGGIVKCRISREISPNGEKLRDLRESWFFLGAYGSVDGGNPGQHAVSARRSSNAKILVSEGGPNTNFPIRNSGINTKIPINGILMALAWIGFATVG